MKLKGYEQLAYYSLKEFQKKYPKGVGGYTVIGIIGKGVGKKQKEQSIFVDGEEVKSYPYKSPGFGYEIKGYLAVGENQFIAVQSSKIVKIILLLLLIAAGALVAWQLVEKNLPKDSAGVPLDPSSGKYEAPLELPENADPAHITLPGLSKIYMDSGTDICRVALWNPDNNPCYFQYEIILKESNETIYESGYIEPGNAVTEVKFDRTFTEGEYPIKICIFTYNLLDYEQRMNGGELDAKLIVR